MSKYKICPACDTKNNPSSMECISCSYDLMSTPIVDDSVINTEVQQHEPSEPRAEVEMVRICYCGEINPPQLRKCQACKEDISDILPVPKPQEQEKVVEIHYQLENLGSRYIFVVPCGISVIGRENAMKECLQRKSFVSRTHARLIAEDGKLFIENLSKTNYTFVNDKKITEGRTELKLGDEIGLGGMSINGNRQEQAAYFIVGKTV